MMAIWKWSYDSSMLLHAGSNESIQCIYGGHTVFVWRVYDRVEGSIVSLMPYR